MQVFKTFIKVMKKRLHISLIYITVFVAICVGLTLVSEKTNKFESSKLDISIIDMDNSDASRDFTEFIGKYNNLKTIENNKDIILDSLYYMTTDIVLTINEGYSEKLRNGETEGLFSDYRIPDTFSAEFFDTQVNQYIGNITAFIAGGMTLEEASSKATEISEKRVEVEILNFSESKNVEYDDNIAGFFQYLAYILLMVLISGLCPTLLVMTKKEISNRTNCSSFPITKQITQIVAGTIIFAVAVYTFLLIIAAILYNSMLFNEKGLLAIINGFAYLLFATILTLCIAVISPSARTTDMIANVVGLGMSFLCGVFVPQYLLSESVLNIGKFFPAYWYIKANNILAGTNNTIFELSEFLICIGVEFAFSLTLFCITLLIAKTKRSSKTI